MTSGSVKEEIRDVMRGTAKVLDGLSDTNARLPAMVMLSCDVADAVGRAINDHLEDASGERADVAVYTNVCDQTGVSKALSEMACDPRTGGMEVYVSGRVEPVSDVIHAVIEEIIDADPN